MSRNPLSRSIAAALLAAACAPAWAISTAESNATLPFSFSNPGARSLAMGGAFLGLADDATAAYTNPAGLTRLGLSKQFSVEVRRNDFTTPYPASGTFGTRPFDLSGVNYRDAENDVSELSFVSFVFPRETWSLAVYRHQLLNYENSYVADQIDFAVTPEFPGNFIRPVRAHADVSIVSYGLAFGHTINSALSWGFGVAWNDFEINTATQRFDPENPGEALNTQSQRGDDTDFSYSLGLLYRGSDSFSVGVAYRSGPQFDYRSTNIVAPPGESPITAADFTTSFEAPDSIGIGFSWRPLDQLTLNLDINHVRYSNLANRVDDAFFSGEFAELTDQQRLRGFDVKDQIEPRLGMEYGFFNMKYPLFLRAGAWRESVRSLRFFGDPDDQIHREYQFGAGETYAAAVLFSSGEDEMHYSLGFGLAFSKFQLDFAYDMSDNQDTLSLSGVLRWD